MKAPPARLLAALAAALVGCGDDEVVAIIDAGIPDAAVVDADDRCPGELTFEAFAADLESDTAVFGVEVVEVGDEGNPTTSAPNGRVVLCLPPGSDSEVRAEKTDYLTRLDAVAVDAVPVRAGLPYPLHVIATTAADALLDGLGTPRDESAAQVVVSVLDYPGGTPLTGATVAIDLVEEAAYARDAGGDFAPGDEIAAGGLILFANVPIAGGSAAITVTPPDSFDGSCIGPSSVPLEAGALSGAFFACQ